MIHNVIFDMGGVMIRYDPTHFIEREGVESAGDRELLLKAVFHSKEWPMLDAGDLNEADAEPIMLARLPERLHETARRLLWSWERPMEPIPGMADLARDCKAAGLHVYLLSNASARQPEYWPDIPGSECFDGAVISALVHCVKPHRDIFEHLLARFSLNADECLFIDDMPANVRGAIDAGFHGAVFTGDVDALRRAVFGEKA